MFPKIDTPVVYLRVVHRCSASQNRRNSNETVERLKRNSNETVTNNLSNDVSIFSSPSKSSSILVMVILLIL